MKGRKKLPKLKFRVKARLAVRAPGDYGICFLWSFIIAINGLINIFRAIKRLPFILVEYYYALPTFFVLIKTIIKSNILLFCY